MKIAGNTPKIHEYIYKLTLCLFRTPLNGHGLEYIVRTNMFI